MTDKCDAWDYNHSSIKLPDEPSPWKLIRQGVLQFGRQFIVFDDNKFVWKEDCGEGGFLREREYFKHLSDAKRLASDRQQDLIEMGLGDPTAEPKL
jgi:hypothetical protein